MFPATTAVRPDACSIAAINMVTVDFPLVPVTATTGTVARSIPRSTSPRTGTPAAAAAANTGCPGRTPGLGTTRSARATSSGQSASAGFSTTSAPSPTAIARCCS